MNDDIIFLDTNILFYLYSRSEPRKRTIALDILASHDVLSISTQVINEFINVMLRKEKTPWSTLSLTLEKELLAHFQVIIVGPIIINNALSALATHNYSYYDSLMIAAALESKAHTLYSEDMHHEHTISGTLKIINPFAKPK